MNHVKQLAGQTLVYGLGIVLPRLLNYLLLTPFYTRIFTRAEYGVITELYAYVVFLMVLLTYGLETGLFRFADKKENRDSVYKTSLISIYVSSFLFIIVSLIFSRHIANGLDYSGNVSYISMLVLIVGIDALTAIPFAKIRLDNRPVKYALIRIVEVLTNIGFNLFFLYWCPRHYMEYPWLQNIYDPNFGVGYVLLSNLFATTIKSFLLFEELFFRRGRFNVKLWKDILKYSLPLLIAGLAGTVNEAIDRVMLRHMTPEALHPLQQLGVYGANYKLAVLMTLFIQMFRYAAEPFFFSKKNEQNAKLIYADVMKYFIFIGMVIFLGVMLYIDVFKLFIGKDFREGLQIVPVVLMANLFMGIFFNQSIWYKLQNLTRYGAYLVIIGALITIFINYFFIPVYGYYASAWGHFISYLVMIIISWFLGKKFYDIKYNLRNIFFTMFVGLLIWFVFSHISFSSRIFEYGAKGLSLLAFVMFFYLNERGKLKSLIKS